jgi:hypothetical protein
MIQNENGNALELEGTVCTKPFDAENSRYADSDTPCRSGEA